MILTVAQIEVFLLIFARVAGIFLTAPIISGRSIPRGIKAAAAFWISLILWFVIPLQNPLPTTPVILIIALTQEVLIGVIIGLVCWVIFFAVQAAGEILDLQMGLSVATMMDPNLGAPTSVVGRLAFFISVFVFLIIDGHHLIFSGLMQSFRALPLAGVVNFGGNFVNQMIETGSYMWLTAVQLAAPMVLIIFLLDFTLGIVSRVAPQVNVFMLGFQMKPSLGLLGLYFILPLFVKRIIGLTLPMSEAILKLFANLK